MNWFAALSFFMAAAASADSMNVPDAEALKKPFLARYPFLALSVLRVRELAGREGEARGRLFERCCPLGSYRIADVDGVLLDIAERT
jgi:hypothetical protein